MPLVIPEGFSEVALTFSGVALPFQAVCTFGVDQPDADPPSELLDLLEAELPDLMNATCTSDVQISNLHVKQGPVSTGVFADRGVNIVGNQASDSPPQQTALNVRKITNEGGRKGRGRMFWPGYPESVLGDDGTFGGSALDQFNDAFEAFRTALDAADNTMVLLHSDPGVAPTVITELSVGSRTITLGQRNRPR